MEILHRARYDTAILRYGDVGDPFGRWIMVSKT